MLTLSHDEGGARAAARDDGALDRFGQRGADFHAEVAAGFARIAAQEGERVRAIDASGAPEAVTQRILADLSDLLS